MTKSELVQAIRDARAAEGRRRREHRNPVQGEPTYAELVARYEAGDYEEDPVASEG